MRPTARRLATALADVRATTCVVLPRHAPPAAATHRAALWPLSRVGESDRGMGLRYPDPAPASESGALRPDELFVVKIQAPLDDSSDAAAGIGRMVPTTLLLKDRHGALVRQVEEEERGHNALLRAALRRREQSVHVYAELRAPFLSRAELRVYPETEPALDETDW